MELLKKELIVTKISSALFVPFSGGSPVHRDRPSHGFAFCVDCTLTYRFSTGQAIQCVPGDCIYLPMGSHYVVERNASSDTNPPGVGTHAINFLLLGVEKGESPEVLHIRGRDEVLSCFIKTENAWRQRQEGFREECFSSLYRLMRLFRRESALYAPLDHTLQKLAPALDYIEANYTTQTISLSHLAHLCSVSEPYLRKLFRSAFSVSPAVYIRNLRLNYARELLRTGEYSVTDAALLSGFNDAAYFSREFRKVTGVPPNRYRP